jgi:hypothetical protein
METAASRDEVIWRIVRWTESLRWVCASAQMGRKPIKCPTLAMLAGAPLAALQNRPKRKLLAGTSAPDVQTWAAAISDVTQTRGNSAVMMEEMMERR